MNSLNKGVYYVHMIGLWICFYNNIILLNTRVVSVKGLNNILFQCSKHARDYTSHIRLCVNCQHNYRTYYNMMIY